MRINKQFIGLLKVGIINMFILSGCFLSNYIPYFNGVWYLIFIGMYYFYLFKLNDETEIVLHQIIMVLLSVFILDCTFHYLKMNTPLELQYLPEGISIILCIKILSKRKIYNNLLKDPFLKIILGIFIISMIIEVINLNNIVDLLNALRIYFRFLPVYIVLSKRRVDYKLYYKIIYIINLIFFAIESYVGVFVDFRTGIFGIVGGSGFQLFVLVLLVYMEVKFYKKETSGWKFITVLLLTLSMFVINENKAFIFLTIIILGLISMIINSSGIKKVVTVLTLIILFFVGMNFMAKLNPKFEYLLNYNNLAQNVEDYIFGNSNKIVFKMGRFEAMQYISNIEQNDLFSKMFGIGLGESMPQEKWFYFKTGLINQHIVDFPKSRIYDKYGPAIGYHLSNFSTIFIDGGYLASIVSLLIIGVWFYKGRFIIKNAIYTKEIFIGAMTICIAIGAIYSCGYSSGLTQRGYILGVMILLGMAQNYYLEIKERKSLEIVNE